MFSHIEAVRNVVDVVVEPDDVMSFQCSQINPEGILSNYTSDLHFPRVCALVDFEIEHWFSRHSIVRCSDPSVPCYKTQKQLICKALNSPSTWNESTRPLRICVRISGNWAQILRVSFRVDCWESGYVGRIRLAAVRLSGDWVKPSGKIVKPCLSRGHKKCCAGDSAPHHSLSIIVYFLEMSVYQCQWV